MDNLELDNEIIITKVAIEELRASKDYEAMSMAQYDLSYLISILNN